MDIKTLLQLSLKIKIIYAAQGLGLQITLTSVMTFKDIPQCSLANAYISKGHTCPSYFKS